MKIMITTTTIKRRIKNEYMTSPDVRLAGTVNPFLFILSPQIQIVSKEYGNKDQSEEGYNYPDNVLCQEALALPCSE